MALISNLITFSPNTTIRSQDVNTNFQNLNTISSLPIPFGTFTSDDNAIVTDGNGNLVWNGAFGKTATYTDIFDGRGDTTYMSSNSASGQIKLTINGTQIMGIDSTGPRIGGTMRVLLQSGGLRHLSTFTGSASGTFNHNNNGTPDTVALIATNSTSENFGVYNFTTTQVSVNVQTATVPFIAQCFGIN